MGLSASIHWHSDETNARRPRDDYGPAFKSDGKAFASWMIAIQDRANELALVETLKLGVLVRCFWTDDLSDKRVAWTTPSELEQAATAARQLLLERDPRIEPVLRIYAEHGYHAKGGAASTPRYSSAAWSSLEWRANIREALRENPFLVAPALAAAEHDSARADFRVVVEASHAGAGEAWAVEEDEARFGKVAVLEEAADDEDAMQEILRRWLPPGTRLREGALYYRAETKLMEAEHYVDDVERHRAATLVLAKTIAAGQRSFFRGGPDWLRPSRIDDLTRAAKLNEELIRLLLKNNTLQTPHGLFSLEYFVTAPQGRLAEARPEPLLQRWFQAVARRVSSWRMARQLDSERKAMAQDLLDLTAMARWAEQHGLKRVAIGIR
jgi:hypothetical protein